MSDAQLFEPPDPSGPAGATMLGESTTLKPTTRRDTAARAVVPTCRSNVLEWLSSGLITPKRAFAKYYEDALALREDVVPAMRVPVPAGCLQVEGSVGNFPVLVEVDDAAVRWLEDGSVGYLPSTPLTVARALHFRDENERDEFEARVYDNVLATRVALAVSPEIFVPSPESSIAMIKGRLRDAEQGPTAAQFHVADRVSGARTVGMHAAMTSKEMLQWFSEAAFRTPARRPSRKKLKHPKDWLALSPSLADYRPAKNAAFDERLFLAAASVFLAHERADAWDAQAVLDRISAKLATDDALSEADQKRWNGARTRAQAVLRGDEAFVGFKTDEYRSEKALLLALVRAGPMDVLTWRDEGVRADAFDLLVAAALAGLAHGRKALPTNLRPEPLDDALALRELADLDNRPVQLSVEARDDVEAGTLVLAIERRDVFGASRPARTAAELLEELDLSDSSIAEALVALATDRAWDDAVETTIRVRGMVGLRAVRSDLEITMSGVPRVESKLRPVELKIAVSNELDPEVRARLAELAAGRTDVSRR